MHNTHISSLEAKHNTLDRRIAEEAHRPLPNQLLLAELKRRKLRVKEQISAQ